jgi:hypothetical protein
MANGKILQSVVQPKTRIVADYSVSMGTSDLAQSQVIIEPLGDITALEFRITQSTTGTLTGPRPIETAIKSIVVVDRAGKPILDIKGTDLPKLDFWTNGVGSYNPSVNTSSTPQIKTWVIALPIKLEDQPAKLQVVFAPYTDMASSGATGGSVALRITAWYGVAPYTLRIYKRDLSLSAGDNNLGINLVDGKDILPNGLTLDVASEATINHITFSSDGRMDERAKLPLAELIEIERIVYKNGHITGLINLFVAPFRTDISRTKLTINASASTTVTVWHFATN